MTDCTVDVIVSAAFDASERIDLGNEYTLWRQITRECADTPTSLRSDNLAIYFSVTNGSY